MNKPEKYVIQRHERQNEPTHWDLMLETTNAGKSCDILETYRVGIPPEKWGGEPIKAARIFDHATKFLTYQGPVNKGKGNVKIADSGIYGVISRNDNRMTIRFTGEVLKGEFIFEIEAGPVRRE